MIKLIFFFLLIACFTISKAQKIDSANDEKTGTKINTRIFTAVEHEPHFDGGVNGFKRYLANNLIYPEKARLHNIKGDVVVDFVVEKDGSLSDLKIRRGQSAEIDAEALRLMKNSPKWIPGIQNGNTVRVAISVVLSFPQLPLLIPKDTEVYYVKNVKSGEVLVKSRDSADFYRVLLPPDPSQDKTLLGINEFYKNGRKRRVGSAIIINRQLLLSGSCIEFYENGKRKSIVNYVDGVLSGDFSQYFPNGILYITGEHGPNGNMIVKESRDSTGNITASDEPGV